MDVVFNPPLLTLRVLEKTLAFAVGDGWDNELVSNLVAGAYFRKEGQVLLRDITNCVHAVHVDENGKYFWTIGPHASGAAAVEMPLAFHRLVSTACIMARSRESDEFHVEDVDTPVLPHHHDEEKLEKDIFDSMCEIGYVSRGEQPAYDVVTPDQPEFDALEQIGLRAITADTNDLIIEVGNGPFFWLGNKLFGQDVVFCGHRVPLASVVHPAQHKLPPDNHAYAPGTIFSYPAMGGPVFGDDQLHYSLMTQLTTYTLMSGEDCPTFPAAVVLWTAKILHYDEQKKLFEHTRSSVAALEGKLFRGWIEAEDRPATPADRDKTVKLREFTEMGPLTEAFDAYLAYYRAKAAKPIKVVLEKGDFATKQGKRPLQS